MEHALVQLYQPQNHSLGCIPGLRTFSRRKLRRHGKGLGRNFLFEMPDNISVHDFKGPQHPREEKSAHQGTASSYSPWILFGACSQYYPSVALTTSSYFNYISTLIFFIPIIIKLLTILLFWCLSTPFWTCDMDKNTFLNDMHHTPFDEEMASLIIWQKKHWGSHSDLESGNPYNNLLVLPHFPPPLSSKVFHILEHEHRPWGKSWVVVKRGGLDEDSQVQILVSPFSNCVNLLGSVPKRGWDRDLDAHSLVEG